MAEAAPLLPCSRVAVIPGRSFHWAPQWPCSEGRVLFDQCSGDYWVLSGPAAQLLTTLATGAMEAPALAAWHEHGGMATASDARGLIAGLMRSRLIDAWDNAGHPLSPDDLAELD
jgi:hypothetical protein